MIMVKLRGGLGNQMFQYAVGRHIAEIHKTVLKIDISEFETYTLRKYSLSPFNIQENFATPEEVAALTVGKRGVVERLTAKALRRPIKMLPTYIKEKSFHFDPDILKISTGVYLEGYWQSEKYFKDIEGIIRSEFIVKQKPDAENKLMAEKIVEVKSVSLHVRRCDYVVNPITSQVHGTCSPDYYHAAVNRLTDFVKDPHFFVFSDDPLWARENIKIGYPATYIDHNGPDKNYEDLRLMSQCKHHIIANSTFSWWGAWLNPNPDKIVLAPKRWFKAEGYDTKDLIPDGWIRT